MYGTDGVYAEKGNKGKHMYGTLLMVEPFVVFLEIKIHQRGIEMLW